MEYKLSGEQGQGQNPYIHVLCSGTTLLLVAAFFFMDDFCGNSTKIL